MRSTRRVKRTLSRPKIVVTADGRGVVGHAGARLLTDLADATGLATVVSDALVALRQRESGHDPGRIALDLAVMLADGGEAIADLAVLRGQAICLAGWRRIPPRGGCWPPSTTTRWLRCAARAQARELAVGAGRRDWAFVVLVGGRVLDSRPGAGCGRHHRG